MTRGMTTRAGAQMTDRQGGERLAALADFAERLLQRKKGGTLFCLVIGDL